MQPKDVFSKMVRPKILLRAAQAGLRLYEREVSLRHLLGLHKPCTTQMILEALLEREATLEHDRQTRNIRYNMSLHIQVMTALLKELTIKNTAQIQA